MPTLENDLQDFCPLAHLKLLFSGIAFCCFCAVLSFEAAILINTVPSHNWFHLHGTSCQPCNLSTLQSVEIVLPQRCLSHPDVQIVHIADYVFSVFTG